MVSIENSSLIGVVTHATELYGPPHALESYLKQKSKKFLLVLHPLPISSLTHSNCRFYVDGRLVRHNEYRTFRFPEAASYLHHLFLTIYIFVVTGSKIDTYIGVDNLNAFVGILLRFLRVVNRVVFYVIDYTPMRFKNKILNSLYHALNVICAKHADYVWSVSERIASLWRKFGIDDQKNIVVPIGIELKEIKKVPANKARRNVLVFVSHLTKSKGIQLTIEAIEEITKKFEDVRLEVIGTGPFESELKEIVKRKKLEKYVKFLGVMEHEKLMQYLPTCGIALATYEPDPGSITYYADPTKPKEYLACGLPVIITNVPWIAKEIEKRPMGIVIKYNKYELINAIIKFLTDQSFYEICRKNAIEFASGLDWKVIFDNAFANLR